MTKATGQCSALHKCARCKQMKPAVNRRSLNVMGNWCEECRNDSFGGIARQQIIGSYFDQQQNMVVKKLAPADAMGWL